MFQRETVVYTVMVWYILHAKVQAVYWTYTVFLKMNPQVQNM